MRTRTASAHASLPASASAARRAPARAAAWVTALALAWLAAGGCSNPFRPSEPAPPAGSVGVSAVNIDYTTADLTLETIKEAIEAKGQLNGLAAYTGALLPVTANAPGFTCVFDPQVVADRQLQGHQIPTWTPELELQTFYRYLSQLNTENYVMTWSTYQDAPLDNIDLVAGTAILYRAYQLTAVSQDNVAELLSIGRSSTAGSPRTSAGAPSSPAWTSCARIRSSRASRARSSSRSCAA